ncbi:MULTISPECIES: hypothetical protein [unclassified Streptomyces]|nr:MULTISPECIES: hypothetical protein [unclassified Streptomyces]MYS23797.1 hypothetical protein [Streptomyces sp. SID4948]
MLDIARDHAAKGGLTVDFREMAMDIDTSWFDGETEYARPAMSRRWS